MVSPDLTICEPQKAKDDLKAKANALKALLKHGDVNNIDIKESADVLQYLSTKGHIKSKTIKSSSKVKQTKKPEKSEKPESSGEPEE